jgi:uncharacterized membrane protein YbhN (UPF0104 family)
MTSRAAPSPPPPAETDLAQRSAPDGDADANPADGWRRLLPRFVAGLVLALIVVTALALFADLRELGDALAGFDWWLAIPIIGLTLLNYALRFVKWQIYLGRIGVRGIPLLESALTFLSAFSMSVTPGKVGEIIKAVYVRRLTGTPVSRVAAIIAAERLTDGLAMLGLAAIGLTQFSYGRPLLAVAALLGIGVIVLLRRPALLNWLVGLLGRLPIIGPVVFRLTHHVEHFIDASNALYAPRLVVGSVLLGMLSWFAECLALFLVLAGLGQEATWHLLLVATFILSVSSVFGALSFLPGGLGIAEASITAMLILLITDPEFTRGDAAAATILIRFATLWFSVLLGVGAVAILQRRLRGRADHPDLASARSPSVAPGTTST